jgi:hypothetical protein
MNFFNASMVVLKIILLKKNHFVNFSSPLIFFFRAFVLQSAESRLRPIFFVRGMKDEFAFLYPAPRSVRRDGAVLDIRSLCFPLEILKKYDFLFEHFRVRNRNRGLEVVFQEGPSRSPARGRDLAGEAYAIDGGPERIVLSACTARARFYALSTLMQILAFHESSGWVPAFALRDAPALAFRGFLFAGEPGAVPGADKLRDLLLKLALLKFSHFALPASSIRQNRGGPDGLKPPDLDALAAQLRKTGLELILVDADAQSLFRFGRAMESGSPPGTPVFFEAAASGEEARPADWLEFFLAQHRRGKTRGERTAVWGDIFLRHPEWIRKLPQDILVLNRERSPERGDLLRTAVLPFKKHHIPQVLCPVLCSRDRFIPDTRAGMARVSSACAAAAAGKLAGVMAASCEPGGRECLPEAAAMLHFQAGCLLWSGKLPGPGAFSRWALGRDEPGLFRVYTFLAQVDRQLPHAHGQYLFEDPVFAPFSRPGDAREIEAHYRKAALYLKKRRISRNELTGFLGFARRLFEFIAAKVEFSGRLCSLLDEKGGAEKILRQAAWLGQGTEKLKNFYLELWGKSFLPESLPEGASGFTFLQERFRYLRRAASQPAARENLFLELKNYSPAAGPPAGNKPG